MAITSPLIEESINGATGMLLNITGPEDLGLFEVNEAAQLVQNEADANANIIFGSVVDQSMRDEVRVTVIATGFEGFELLARTPQRVRPRQPREPPPGLSGRHRSARACASMRTTSTCRRSCRIRSAADRPSLSGWPPPPR